MSARNLVLSPRERTCTNDAPRYATKAMDVVSEIESHRILNAEIWHWYKFYRHDWCGHELSLSMASENVRRSKDYCRRVVERHDYKAL